MREQLKVFASILIIIFLAPFILTLFLNGEGIAFGTKREEETVNNVKVMNDNITSYLSWETYFIGVLAKEIPVEFVEEAIKAQAVILRNRLAKEAEGQTEVLFSEEYLTMEEIQEKWQGIEAATMYEQLHVAMSETENEVLMIEGEIIYTPYHYLNNGDTREGGEVFGDDSYPYLCSVTCPSDVQSEQQFSSKEYEYSSLAWLLGIEETLTFEDLEIIEIDSKGYILQIKIKDQLFTGEEFSKKLELNSSCFSFQEKEGRLKITVVGVGHGLGMSQNTANEMALEGKNYEEILKYFYLNSTIEEDSTFLE